MDMIGWGRILKPSLHQKYHGIYMNRSKKSRKRLYRDTDCTIHNQSCNSEGSSNRSYGSVSIFKCSRSKQNKLQNGNQNNCCDEIHQDASWKSHQKIWSSDHVKDRRRVILMKKNWEMLRITSSEKEHSKWSTFIGKKFIQSFRRKLIECWVHWTYSTNRSSGGSWNGDWSNERSNSYEVLCSSNG